MKSCCESILNNWCKRNESYLTVNCKKRGNNGFQISMEHGYAYYYDFKQDDNIQYQIVKLDELIKCMSLEFMGFTHKEIEEYKW